MPPPRAPVAARPAQSPFHDDIVYLKETKRGLTRDTVEEISRFKEEPEWMLQSRLRAYEHFLKRPMPLWTDGLDRIGFDKIGYPRRPEGGRGPPPAAGLFPDQRGEHRPVRPHTHRRRRRRQVSLHRGVHCSHL